MRGILRKVLHHLQLLMVVVCFMSQNVCSQEGGRLPEQLGFQRRFMWKQMGHAMENVMGGMSSSAHVMKSMIGDMLPTLPSDAHSNIMNYLPTETTRVKYIIRNPKTAKPMKIIRIRSPKKRVKIMTVGKPIIESDFGESKHKFPSIEKLRQMEREQELIAEGRLPSNNRPVAEKLTGEPSSGANEYNNYNNNEIVNGKTHGIGEGWSPITQDSNKAYPMSQLHTSIIGETQKETAPNDDAAPEHQEAAPQAYAQESPKRAHAYEVTEHTSEESRALPLTQSNDYSISRGYVARSGTATAAVTTTSSPPTTTTEELPNYPLAYLRKQRLQTPSPLVLHPVKRFKPHDSLTASSWVPLGLASSLHNNTLSRIKIRPTVTTTSLVPAASASHKKTVRITSDRWPLQMPAPKSFFPTAHTDATATFTNTTPVIISADHARALRKFKPSTTPTYKSSMTKVESDFKTRDVRQRGSVKFGDKINLEEY